jgi:hypothetical protein
MSRRQPVHASSSVRVLRQQTKGCVSGLFSMYSPVRSAMRARVAGAFGGDYFFRSQFGLPPRGLRDCDHPKLIFFLKPVYDFSRVAAPLVGTEYWQPTGLKKMPVYSLTGSASSPFHTEPASTSHPFNSNDNPVHGTVSNLEAVGRTTQIMASNLHGLLPGVFFRIFWTYPAWRSQTRARTVPKDGKGTGGRVPPGVSLRNLLTRQQPYQLP